MLLCMVPYGYADLPLDMQLNRSRTGSSRQMLTPLTRCMFATVGNHTLVPFAMEDGGRIGAHGQAVLRMLVEYAVAKGKMPSLPARDAPILPLEAVAMWVRR